jgi:hypothetical protein
MGNFYHFLKKSMFVFSLLLTQVVTNSFAGTGNNPGKNPATDLADTLPPVIIRFTPTNAATGTWVYIYGNHFTGATAVSFGGVPADSFFVSSVGAIRARVGIAGASGNVSVTTPNGTATKSGFLFAPRITSFSPTSGSTGTIITIKGSGFSTVTAVRFGGVPASTFSIASDTVIRATVGSGAGGWIDMSSPNGYTSIKGFTYIDTIPPVITSFSPSSGTRGTRVNIYGRHFASVTAVSFGQTPAASFQVANDSTISAIVGLGSTGKVSVSSPYGTSSRSLFEYVSTPAITSFTPTSGGTGTEVIIRGIHFSGAYNVRFGNTVADTFGVINDSTLFAIVGSGSSGNVSVTTYSGTATKSGFTFISDTTGHDTIPPAIIAFTPTSGRTGDTVAIFGDRFTGATAVLFGGTPAATFGVQSDSLIFAVLGSGSSGNVSVTTPHGTAAKSGFVYKQYPEIKSFSPASAARGDVVTIRGLGFSRVTAVRFGGTPVDTFYIVSDSVIRATVGAGSTGYILVQSQFGISTLGGFTFISNDTTPPVIYRFMPSYGYPGSTVNIYGRNFSGTNAIKFGGTPAASFRFVADTVLVAVVGSGSSGNVSVTNSYGTASIPGFTFFSQDTLGSPGISSFTPASGRTGTSVRITGRGFGGTTSVSFGGTSADTFAILSDSVILAKVGTGSSGAVSVTTPIGVATKPGFTFISNDTIPHDTIPPVIISFTPASATTGDTVAIFGAHFTGATAVRFGGIPAGEYAVFNDSLVVAIVGSGSSGNVSITTPNGTGTKTGFIFTGDTTLIARTTAAGSNAVSTNGAVSLYPNPARLYATITHPVSNHPARLQVIDLSGRVVRTINISNNSFQTKVNVNGLVTGLYKVIWSDGKKKIAQTLVVK